MGADAVVVLAVLALVLGFLIFTRAPADVVTLGGLTLMLVLPVPHDDGWRMGVLNTRAALAGFSNSGMITVGVLFVVVTGLRSTGAIDWLAQTALGRPAGLRRALMRIIFPVCGMSAFLNNTPVVAMFIPAITDWAHRLRMSPSKLMIPLSYAAILGGTCSLIGTSTNLVVAGLVTTHADLTPLKMFDITWIGLPAAIVGGTFLIFVGPLLLPKRGSPGSVLSDPREYTAEMLVPPESHFVGQTIEQAGLRNLPGCYLVEIDRDGEILPAVGPDQRLHANDRLVFAGVVESIKELQGLRGFVPATNQVFKLDSPRHSRRLFEAVVSDTCPVVGRTIKQGRFRTVYNAAVIAVARNGTRLSGKIGEIVLRAGDVLLLEAAAGFEERQRDARDFLLVKTLADSSPRRHERALPAIAILVAMVAVAAFGWLDMLRAAMLAAGLMLFMRCCSISEARRSVDWSVLIVIASALGFGAALEQSGAAKSLADAVLSLAGEHPWLVLAGIYLTTSLLTEIITNNAAVALVFPIALATAEQLGVDFRPFVMAIMMAGSASFATPLGYQTNMMVYGPGGYTFADFLRIGVVMNLLMAAVCITLIPMLWSF